MTEIPEHLLQRSRERRAALGGGDGGSTEGGDAGEATESPAPEQAAAAPAPSMPAHAAPAEEPPPPPPSPMVEAYQRRRKIPFWAMPVLAALPLWAYVFAGTLEPPPAGEGPLTLGEQLYAGQGCGGCHGAGGGGGVGPAFTGGAIYETFPDFTEHFEWVRLGSQGWLQEHGDTYGANDSPVDGGMPGFGQELVSDANLAAIILYERIGLGGPAPDPEQAATLEEIATLLLENPQMTWEEALEEIGASPEGEGGGEEAVE